MIPFQLSRNHSMSMEFLQGLLRTKSGEDCVFVLQDTSSKLARLVLLRKNCTIGVQ